MMRSLDEIKTGYFERRQGLSVFIKGRPGFYSSLINRSEFEGGCVITSQGRTNIFSGAPPRHWGKRLSSPTNCEQPEEVFYALGSLAKKFTDNIKLCYSSFVSLRLVTGTTLSPLPKSVNTWALSGHIKTAKGHILPVGWSSGGQGLKYITDKSAVESLIWTAKAVNQAEVISPATIPSVLSPAASAVLLHEAAGHFAEAAVIENVNYNHRLGCRIASEQISLYDNPLFEKGPAQYKIDDDGVASLAPTEVVRDGVLIAQLHSLSSAKLTGMVSTANGRAASAWNFPIPRISNLICSFGKASEAEILENLDSGIYIHQLADGFSLGAKIDARIVLAEWVKNGKLTGNFLTGGRISEKLNLLTRVVEIANNRKFNSNAMCGKAGQILLDVGTYAPSIRFSSLRIAA